MTTVEWVLIGIVVLAAIFFVVYEGRKHLSAIHKLAGIIEDKTTPAPAAATEAMPIAGKLGQAGVFKISVQVAGDPATDMPVIQSEITKAYFPGQS